MNAAMQAERWPGDVGIGGGVRSADLTGAVPGSDAQDRPARPPGQVYAEQTIAASAKEVWSVVSRPGNLELCHPFCASNPVRQWPGSNSRDEVHYLSGWVYERRFRNWIEGIGYDLEIGRPGGGQSRVSWRMKPIGDRSCSLRITVCPHALQHIPTAIRWIPHLLIIRPQLRKHLNSVVKGVE